MRISIQHSYNKAVDTTYVYDVTVTVDSDGTKHQHRKMIGKIDKETGKTIPTGKRGRPSINRKVDWLHEEAPRNPDYKALYEEAIAARQEDSTDVERESRNRSNIVKKLVRSIETLSAELESLKEIAKQLE